MDDHSSPNPALARSTTIFINELLQLQTGEDFLVYSDQNSDLRVEHAIVAQAQQQGHRTELLKLDAAQPLIEQAADLAEHIRRGRFNAICELSDQYFYLTEAWPTASEMGARVYSIAGLDSESFIRCIGGVNHEQMFTLGMALRELLLISRNLEIRSAKGTHIHMKLGWNLLDRLMARILTRWRGNVDYPSGYRGGFLGGQLAFLGIPQTIEGTVVIDSFLWPPAEIGVLTEPIILKFKAGKLIQISGNSEKVDMLTRRFEDETASLEHVCFGFNPGARFTGKIVEAERVFGCLNIGFGSGLLHVDGVMRNPTVLLDGEVILDDGKFVKQELAAIERELLNKASAEAE
jgi:leucyl aminopeptidase (aminopeptidase T)